MATLYRKLPAQIYIALQSPQGRDERLDRRRVGSEMVEVERTAVGRGRAGAADGTASRYKTDW